MREELGVSPTVNIFKESNNRVVQDLQDGENVVYDATNLKARDRAKLLEIVKCDKISCYLFTTDIETCLERNALREGRARVPEKTIHKMNNSFEKPKIEEGFDEIVEFSGKEKNMGKKYEFTGETMEFDGHTLHGIRNINTNELGGWIESEKNLSQEDDC